MIKDVDVDDSRKFRDEVIGRFIDGFIRPAPGRAIIVSELLQMFRYFLDREDLSVFYLSPEFHWSMRKIRESIKRIDPTQTGAFKRGVKTFGGQAPFDVDSLAEDPWILDYEDLWTGVRWATQEEGDWL